ncbi:hypothetical protein SeLEV6574_g03901 [Synchytrium endobioticum]|uniref:LAG1-DNAbind-domain-containing protein n=1 Tax=Synchytrium endobioticum TaxID=286115 RepID=A0A507D1R7_9FUNG|nr:hypothetical protein SeLEV6574_g03901 [Synchytrium endobioticum]
MDNTVDSHPSYTYMQNVHFGSNDASSESKHQVHHGDQNLSRDQPNNDIDQHTGGGKICYPYRLGNGVRFGPTSNYQFRDSSMEPEAGISDIKSPRGHLQTLLNLNHGSYHNHFNPIPHTTITESISQPPTYNYFDHNTGVVYMMDHGLSYGEGILMHSPWPVSDPRMENWSMHFPHHLDSPVTQDDSLVSSYTDEGSSSSTRTKRKTPSPLSTEEELETILSSASSSSPRPQSATSSSSETNRVAKRPKARTSPRRRVSTRDPDWNDLERLLLSPDLATSPPDGLGITPAATSAGRHRGVPKLDLQQLSHVVMNRMYTRSDECSIVWMHPVVVQRSYGKEKRYFTPPPTALLFGSGWNLTSPSPEFVKALVQNDPIPYTSPSVKPFLSFTQPNQRSSLVDDGSISGTLMIENMKVSHLGRTLPFLSRELPDAEMPVARVVFKTISCSEATEKRRQFHLHLDMVENHNEQEIHMGSLSSLEITVISKPSKKKSANKRADSILAADTITSGSLISLFTRTRCQHTSTRFMCLGQSREDLAPAASRYDAFQIWNILDPQLPNILKDDEVEEAISITKREVGDITRAHDALYFDDVVILYHVGSGLATKAMILRRVDAKTNSVEINDHEPFHLRDRVALSQLNKIALQIHSSELRDVVSDSIAWIANLGDAVDVWYSQGGPARAPALVTTFSSNSTTPQRQRAAPMTDLEVMINSVFANATQRQSPSDMAGAIGVISVDSKNDGVDGSNTSSSSISSRKANRKSRGSISSKQSSKDDIDVGNTGSDGDGQKPDEEAGRRVLQVDDNAIWNIVGVGVTEATFYPRPSGMMPGTLAPLIPLIYEVKQLATGVLQVIGDKFSRDLIAFIGATPAQSSFQSSNVLVIHIPHTSSTKYHDEDLEDERVLLDEALLVNTEILPIFLVRCDGTVYRTGYHMRDGKLLDLFTTRQSTQ